MKLPLLIAFVLSFLFLSLSANASITINSPLNITYEQYGNPNYDTDFSITGNFNSSSCKLNYSSTYYNLTNATDRYSWTLTKSLTTNTYSVMFNCTNTTGGQTYTNTTTFSIIAHGFSLMSLTIAGLFDIIACAGLVFISMKVFENEFTKKKEFGKEFGAFAVSIILGFIIIQIITSLIAGF